MFTFLKKHWIEVLTLIIAISGGIPGAISTYNHYFSGPVLSIQLETVTYGKVNLPQDTTNYAMYLLSVDLSNEGDRPLTPISFDLKLKYGDGWIDFEPQTIPENSEFNGLYQKINIEKPWLRDLQSFNESIEYAEPVYGFLLFISDKISFQELDSIKTPVFKIICTDIFGRKYTSIINKSIYPIESYMAYPKHKMEISPK